MTNKYDDPIVSDVQAPWEAVLYRAVELFLNQTVPGGGYVNSEHTAGTPDRVVRAFAEMVAGYKQDPAIPLQTTFSDAASLNEMIHFRGIRLVSSCIHHLVPIIAVAHFAYVPNSRVVGLSKVPKYLRVLANRLQVQETLAGDAVNLFQGTVKPMGCGIHIRGYHCCALARGVKEHEMVMETTALRGSFKTNDQTRAEFIGSIDSGAKIL